MNTHDLKPTHEPQYRIVLLFWGESDYLDTETGAIESSQKAYRLQPKYGKTLMDLFPYFTKAIKGETFKGNFPRKLMIYEGKNEIFRLPEGQSTITDRAGNLHQRLHYLKEWRECTEMYIRTNGRQFRVEKQPTQHQPIQKVATVSVPLVKQVPTETIESQETRLKNERNDVFYKLSDYCNEKLGYKLNKSTNFNLFEKIVANIKIQIKDIPDFYEEGKLIIDKEVEETSTFKPLLEDNPFGLPLEDDNEPVEVVGAINTAFKKTTKATTKTQTDLSIFIDAAIETLSKLYEKTNRKATDEVKKVFENAFSRCKDVSKIDAVFTNFQYQIEKGEF